MPQFPVVDLVYGLGLINRVGNCWLYVPNVRCFATISGICHEAQVGLEAMVRMLSTSVFSIKTYGQLIMARRSMPILLTISPGS